MCRVVDCVAGSAIASGLPSKRSAFAPYFIICEDATDFARFTHRSAIVVIRIGVFVYLSSPSCVYGQMQGVGTCAASCHHQSLVVLFHSRHPAFAVDCLAAMVSKVVPKVVLAANYPSGYDHV